MCVVYAFGNKMSRDSVSGCCVYALCGFTFAPIYIHTRYYFLLFFFPFESKSKKCGSTKRLLRLKKFYGLL